MATAQSAPLHRSRWIMVCLMVASTILWLPNDAAAGEPAPDAVAAQDRVSEILEALVANQEKAIAARNAWLFRQRTFVRLLRSNGDLAREQAREFDVRPMPDGIEREQTAFEGKVAIGKEIYPYADPSYRTGDIDLDGEIAESFAEDVLFHKESRDNLSDEFFPISRTMLARHDFRLAGEEIYRERPVYRLTFRPAKKSRDTERGDWKGEVLVDAETFQPVLVITQQAHGVPFAVRTLLGSNVKQFGFKLEYAEVEEGLWFPKRYSGEFSLRVLFGYSRRIALSVENFEFQKATAESTIRFGADGSTPVTETARPTERDPEMYREQGAPGSAPDTNANSGP